MHQFSRAYNLSALIQLIVSNRTNFVFEIRRVALHFSWHSKMCESPVRTSAKMRVIQTEKQPSGFQLSHWLSLDEVLKNRERRVAHLRYDNVAELS